MDPISENFKRLSQDYGGLEIFEGMKKDLIQKGRYLEFLQNYIECNRKNVEIYENAIEK